MRTIHNQFDASSYDIDTFELLMQQGWTDESWDNDPCPCLTFENYRLWFEAIDPKNREDENYEQFLLTRDGNDFKTFETSEELVNFIENFDETKS